MPIDKELLDILACPICKGVLTLTSTREESGEVVEGALSCAAGLALAITALDARVLTGAASTLAAATVWGASTGIGAAGAEATGAGVGARVDAEVGAGVA